MRGSGSIERDLAELEQTNVFTSLFLLGGDVADPRMAVLGVVPAPR